MSDLDHFGSFEHISVSYFVLANDKYIYTTHIFDIYYFTFNI